MKLMASYISTFVAGFVAFGCLYYAISGSWGRFSFALAAVAANLVFAYRLSSKAGGDQ